MKSFLFALAGASFALVAGTSYGQYGHTGIHYHTVPHTTTHYHAVPHGNHYDLVPHTTTHYDRVPHATVPHLHDSHGHMVDRAGHHIDHDGNHTGHVGVYDGGGISYSHVPYTRSYSSSYYSARPAYSGRTIYSSGVRSYSPGIQIQIGQPGRVYRRF
jgi:hypothetical protein